jgi:predicted phage terminase large subunit-like protein
MMDFSLLPEVIALKSLYRFVRYVMPSFQQSYFHESYYRALGLFASGTIRKLIVTIPPQHGKSLGSTQMLPIYLLGLNPALKIAIASYAFSLASKFNRLAQRVMLSEAYAKVFPLVKLKENSTSDDASGYAQTAENFEVVRYGGGIHSVGRGGGLTGNEVDIMIIDDLYKDAIEGNSPTIRDSVFGWYTSVVKTRLHNESQELIVFTRWHEDDLIGRIEQTEEVRALEDLNLIDPLYKGWYKLNFEAIKESDMTEIDPRVQGEVLWPEKHSAELLSGKRNLDRHAFDCMYQGKPGSREGVLYGSGFNTYVQVPEAIRYSNYTDTADTGDDKLCSICYIVGIDGKIYVTDILYTQEPMEVTEPAVASMLTRNNTRIANIESNNGGRGFARAVSNLVPHVDIKWFHQSGNKEARILSNSSTVLHNVFMPSDWRIRWPEFYNDIGAYKRTFRANRWHDAPDVLTGIVEKEIIGTKLSGVRKFAVT